MSLPYFVERQPFERALSEFYDNNWIASWCEDIAALDAARGGDCIISPPVEMALLSFWDASTNSALDFRMPALVRTIECLVAIPKGKGASLFARRAGLFADDVRNHPFFATTGKTIDCLLEELFQLRSDAVHGKWPLRDMQLNGREDKVALLDFAAEMIARSIIKWALRNRASFGQYDTRARIEDAWVRCTIPVPNYPA